MRHMSHYIVVPYIFPLSTHCLIKNLLPIHIFHLMFLIIIILLSTSKITVIMFYIIMHTKNSFGSVKIYVQVYIFFSQTFTIYHCIMPIFNHVLQRFCIACFLHISCKTLVQPFRRHENYQTLLADVYCCLFSFFFLRLNEWFLAQT